MVRNVFTLMGVCAGKDERGKMLSAHHLAKVF